MGEGGKVIVRGEGINEFSEINYEVVQRKIGHIRLPLSIGGIKSISRARRS